MIEQLRTAVPTRLARACGMLSDPPAGLVHTVQAPLEKALAIRAALKAQRLTGAELMPRPAGRVRQP